MASNQSMEAQAQPTPANLHLAKIAANGSRDHAHLAALLAATGRHSGRDLADAIHLLCALHGRYPGLIEIALERCPAAVTRTWLQSAAEGFERERLFLVRLTSAIGPVPSTPGAAETEASLLAARHALETLAMSERCGCALGAATALVADWQSVRRLLDRAAARVGVDAPVPTLPDEQSLRTVISAETQSPAAARALAFGGEQLLLQHRALFDLLEARAEARGEF